MHMFSGGVIFIVGVLGLVLYALLRFFEISRGKRFFDAVRSRLDAFSSRVYRLAVFGELPHGYRAWFSARVGELVHHAVVALVAWLRAIERPLSRMSRRLRVSRHTSTASREPSSFLKDIKNGAHDAHEKSDGTTPSNQV